MVNVVHWDLPRHNIHHDTSSAFSNNVPLYCKLYAKKAVFQAARPDIYISLTTNALVYLAQKSKAMLYITQEAVNLSS